MDELTLACPECGREYQDEGDGFCVDDGAPLLTLAEVLGIVYVPAEMETAAVLMDVDPCEGMDAV